LVVNAYNINTRKKEIGGLEVWDQSGLHSENQFQKINQSINKEKKNLFDKSHFSACYFLYRVTHIFNESIWWNQSLDLTMPTYKNTKKLLHSVLGDIGFCLYVDIWGEISALYLIDWLLHDSYGIRISALSKILSPLSPGQLCQLGFIVYHRALSFLAFQFGLSNGKHFPIISSPLPTLTLNC
jgi:hypothetical protein